MLSGICIDRREIAFHERLRIQRRGKPVLGVEPMCVTGGKRESAQSLKLMVAENGIHHQLTQPSAAIFRQHKDINKISKGAEVRNNAGERDLVATDETAKT
mgnify:CR=1 FL=1